MSSSTPADDKQPQGQPLAVPVSQVEPELPGLMPTSERFWAFLQLIERDNPGQYTKLRNLD